MSAELAEQSSFQVEIPDEKALEYNFGCGCVNSKTHIRLSNIHWINKTQRRSTKKHLWHNNSQAEMIIKAHGHIDLNHSLSFQRVQCISNIKGPLLSFSLHERDRLPPTHISHCRPNIDLLEGTVNHKLSCHPLPFFITWGFLANTESVYSTEASVFIYEAVLPHFGQCGFSLPTSGLITLGKWLETSLIYPVLRAPCTPLWFWPDTLHKSISCY